MEVKDSYKYLGVLLSSDLGWREQVEAMSSKAIRNLNFVMRNLRGTTDRVREKAYLTLIRPVVEYAGAIWDPYKTGQIKAVEGVQRLAARKVKGRMQRRVWKIREEIRGGSELKIVMERVPESVSRMVEELGWESLSRRRAIARLCNLYKAYTGQRAWKDIGVRLEEPEYRGRKDHEHKIRMRASRRDVGKFSFANRTIPEWNELALKEYPKSVSDLRILLRKKNIEKI